MTEGSAPSDGMRSRVLHGIAWKVASQVFLQGSRVIVAIVLARLLAPTEYGLAAMVLVFGSFVLVFSDLALGAAVVQRHDLSENDRSTVFWTGLGAGIICTIAGVALAAPVARFYDQPEVQPLFTVLSLSFVISSLGATQTALLIREMNFRSLELRMMGGTLVGAIVGIGLAATGFGAWAIVAQQLAIVSVSTVLLWILTPWRPQLRFSQASLRDLGGFSINVFGQRLLYYAQGNADKLLIGRFLGAAPLGIFTLASSVILVPFSRIAVPIAEVLFPAFSRMQDDHERMTVSWIRATRLVGAISVPSLVGLAVLADEFVELVLGARWSAAVPVIQILAWVGLIQSLQTLNSNILMALDRTGTLLRYSVFFFVANVSAYIVGLQWGIVGVAACYAISCTIVEPIYAWLTCRALGTSLWTFGRGIAGVVQAAAIMGVALLVGRTLLERADVLTGISFGLLVVLGTAIYLPCVAWRAPEVVDEIASLRRGRRATAPPLAPPPEPRAG